MSGDVYHDGGRLRQASVAHRHVVEHDDGTFSAIVVRDLPALVCDLCEEAYYAPCVTDAVVRLLEHAPGQAIAVDYAPADAA